MIALTLDQIADITAGTTVGGDGSVVVSGKVEFDSRLVARGDAFLAIRGEHADGADYAAAAVSSGAVAVIGERDLGLPGVVVADPVAALTALARYSAARLDALVVAVTGSAGKTSTKDLLAQVFATAGPTVAPRESFNNELGFPYTVLTAGPATDYLVLEASARKVGDIRFLTGIAAPRIAAVLNVGSAHIGEFGSADNIAVAKGELVEALPPAADGGIAVLNADDARVAAMAARTSARVVTVGQSYTADIRAVDVTTDDRDRALFDLVLAPGAPGAESAQEPLVAGRVRLRLVGVHHVGNALAAAGIALAAGLSPAAVVAALSDARAISAWRMAVSETTDGITVVNDAYNANPESMTAALTSLAAIGRGRRTVAVLGQMAELGEQSVAAHQALGREVARTGVDHLIAVGDPTRPAAEAARDSDGWTGRVDLVEDVTAAQRLLDETLTSGDVVLVKGSHSVALERVALGLLAARGERADDVVASAAGGNGE